MSSSIINVTVNDLPTINAGADQQVCDGTEVTLTATGGVSYDWSNSVEDGVAFLPTVGSFTYTVTGTDANSCVNTDQVTVSVDPLPMVSAGPDQTICEGVQVTLMGSGAIIYSWDNDIDNGVAFTPGHVGELSYTLTGTDGNGCSNTDEVSVTVNEHTASTQTESAMDSYTWLVNGTTYVESGTYTAVSPNEMGCDSTITLVLTLNYTGISENGKNYFTVYPNPATDVLNVVMTVNNEETYVVLDSRGRKVMEGTINGTQAALSIKELAPGTYMMLVGEFSSPVRIIKH
jgi:hypothetical protein